MENRGKIYAYKKAAIKKAYNDENVKKTWSKITDISSHDRLEIESSNLQYSFLLKLEK